MDMLDLMLAQDSAMLNMRGQLVRKGAQLGAIGVKNPIAAAIGVSAIGLAGQGKNINLRTLKNLSGDAALTDEEFLFSKFYLDKFTYRDERLKPFLDELEENKNDPHFGNLYRDVHKVLTSPVRPGGPSNLKELILDTTALQRNLEEDPEKLNLPSTSLDAKSKASYTFEDQVTQIQQGISRMAGENGGRDAQAVEIAGAEGMRTFVSNSKAYYDEFNRKVSEYPMFKDSQPREYKSKLLETYSGIVQFAGGTDKFVSSWNGYFPSNQITSEKVSKLLEGGFLDSEHVSENTRDALLLVEKLSEDPIYKGGYLGRLEDALTNDDGILSVADRIQLEATSVNYGLNKYKNGGAEIGLVQLAKQNPLVAMEEARNWLAVQNGYPETSSLRLANESYFMSDPSEYGGKKE